MGCFDTFVGKIECPYCKEQTRFDEQTKNYECLMQDFKVGDYIDKGNENYFYKFEYPCEHCGEEIIINAAIRRGQLIGYYTDTTNLDINSMENIEENYQRNLEYKQMCEDGYGFDKCLYEDDKYFKLGEVIRILERDWIVEDIFEEQVREHNNERLFNFYKCMFKENRVYRVHDENGNKRLIVTRKYCPTLVTGLIGDENNTEYRAYMEQIGTELVKI